MKPKLIIDGCESISGIKYARNEQTVSLIILNGGRTFTLEMDWREAQFMGERLVKYADQAREHARHA